MKKTCMTMLFIASLFVGCQSSSNRDAYQEFKDDKPKAEFAVTGDVEIDKLGHDTASFYKEVTGYLDKYMAATEGNRTYVAFMNDTVDMNKEETDKYFKTLKPAQQKEILDVKNVKGFNSLKNMGALAAKGTKLYESSKDAGDNFTGFDPAILKKAQSAKNIASQVEYSLKATTFLYRQYMIVNRLNSNQGR